ncbi:unnamed protein product [Owenia fusiformis]|uniref:Uncharacterized protein n=1 Tax=Owenia fusiformis TaxID=6347 RepID=A0A8J1XS09_OWEFU|nr:unnamed protein product [Owenia fusiformis]
MEALLYVCFGMILMVGFAMSETPYRMCDLPTTVRIEHPHAQTSKAPYRIYVKEPQYYPDSILSLSVIGSLPFKTLFLQARDPDTGDTIGRFVRQSTLNVTQIWTCSNTDDTTITTTKLDKHEVILKWEAPSAKDYTGHVQFVGVVSFNDTSYWEDVTSATIPKGFPPIDVSTCGTEKGCFRFGKTDCGHHECDYIFTHSVVNNIINIELSAKGGYAGVGFSSDKEMGGDDILSCVRSAKASDVTRHYWTIFPHQLPKLRSRAVILQPETEMTSHYVSCRFSRYLNPDDRYSLDLNNPYHHLYAWGPTTGGKVQPINTELMRQEILVLP